MTFTIEEINLICCFKGSTKAEIVADMTASLPYMDKEIQDLIIRTITKLEVCQDFKIQQLLACNVTD